MPPILANAVLRGNARMSAAFGRASPRHQQLGCRAGPKAVEAPVKESVVTLVQAWVFIGVPAVALGGAMFIGASRWRPLVGYAILLVGFGGMVWHHAPTGAVFGLIVALLYAAGRGGSGERNVASQSATGLEAAEAAERHAG